MAQLWMRYKRRRSRKSFAEFLHDIGCVDPAEGNPGMDDGRRLVVHGDRMLEQPTQPMTGPLHIKVLLVDFVDRPAIYPSQRYKDLFFSDGDYPTGSLRDFYKEVSCGKMRITGSVHNEWLRMPQKYVYYTNGTSGMEGRYPHNAKRMAEDAVNTAIKKGVTFEKKLSKFNDGVVTALIIVHSGRGGEELADEIAGDYIWSHKWELKDKIEVARDIYVVNYMTVPHDCKVGVCCHELGHLAFGWQDFYDPDYGENRNDWAGTGRWDLMAGGSYNGSGTRPAHPASLHKVQHGWVRVRTVTTSRKIILHPHNAKKGAVVKLISPAYKSGQYLLLENRKREGFDFSLPGAGLLVWKVDERGEMEDVKKAGLYLIQADGKKNLDDDWNEGDAGDPFPGTGKKTSLGDVGQVSTSFGKKRSGITIKNIKRSMSTGVVTLDVEFAKVRTGKRRTVG